MNKLLKKYGSLPRQAKAALWFTICSFMQRGISQLTTPIFSRLLSTSEYGECSVFLNSWLEVATVIVVLKMYAGVYTQDLVKYEEDRTRYVSSMQGLSLTLCLGWTVIYCIFHNFFNDLLDLTTVQMLSMLVMIWATSCFNLWAMEQRVLLNYKKLVIITGIVSVAKPVVGIVFVLLAEDKVTARILGLVVVELAGYGFLFFVNMVKGRVFYSAKYWKHTLILCLPLVPHYLSQVVLSSADRIMIKNMVGESESGIYSLAYTISQIMSIFNSSLIQTINPWIGQKIKNRKAEDIPKLVYISLGLVAFLNLSLIAFAPEAIRIFAPKSYYDAIWVIPPVVMSVYFSYAYSVFVSFEFYFEKTRIMGVATVMGAVLNLVLNYIFINIYGYYAAGYTTLVCYIVYALLHYLFMRSIVRKEIDPGGLFSSRIVLIISSGFVIAGFLMMLTFNSWAIRYSVIAACAIVLFVKRSVVVSSVQSVLAARKKEK